MFKAIKEFLLGKKEVAKPQATIVPSNPIMLNPASVPVTVATDKKPAAKKPAVKKPTTRKTKAK